jgi:hypothetical protein
MLTGETEKLVVAAMPSWFVAVRLTVPVNPLNGVITNVIPEAVAPGWTVTAPLHGVVVELLVIEKSGLLPETTSTDAMAPLG